MSKANRIIADPRKHGFSVFVFFCGFFLSGCFSANFPPSFNESDISASIIKICREEYKFEVVPIVSGKTLWVYAPQERLLHADFGKDPDKIFDETIIEKARNILTSISRVLLSSQKAPDFFVLVLSDIKLGLDYSLTANLMDIKRSAAGGIPWTDANKRYVIGFEQSVSGIGDTRGEHLNVYDINMAEFLSRQIAQRARMFFQDERIKKKLKLKDISVVFKDDKFVLEYSISGLSGGDEELDVPAEILAIVTYCIKTYEFKDFSEVAIKDLAQDKSSVYENKEIWAKSIE